MRKTIQGEKYKFRVVVQKSQFYIEAVHIVSLRFSYINNLNPILSEFDVGVTDRRVSESQWTIPKTQIVPFFKRAVHFLSNVRFREYLEKILDEDRDQGEWENIKLREF